MNRTLATAFVAIALGAAADARAQYTWRTAGVQAPGMQDPGVAGVVVADFDGDGRDDAAIAGVQRASRSDTGDEQPQAGVVAVVRYDASRAAYRLAQWLVGDQSRLTGIASDHGTRPGLVVVSFDGVIEHYTGWPLVRTSRFATGHAVQSMRVGDVDGDGHADVLLADESAGIAAYSLESGALERDYAGRASSSIELAQLDADAALEIVIAGTPGLVVDGATQAVDWQDAGGFGPKLGAGRILGGSRDGFVAGMEWGYFNGYRSVPYSPIWTVKAQQTDALSVADVDLDGVAEILRSGSGGFTVVDALTQAVREQYPFAPLGPMGVGRLRGDAARSYVFGERLNWAGGDTARIVAAGSGDVEYALGEEIGPFHATATADVSGDGVADAVWISAFSSAQYSGGLLHVYDPVKGEERWRGPLLAPDGTPLAPFALDAVAVGALRTSAPADIVVGARAGAFAEALYVVDGATHRVVASNTSIDSPTPIERLLVMQEGGERHVLAVTAGLQRIKMFDSSLHELWSVALEDTSAGPHVLDLQPAPTTGPGVVLISTGLDAVSFDTTTRTVVWRDLGRVVSATPLRLADGTDVIGLLTTDSYLRLLQPGGGSIDIVQVGGDEPGAVRALPGVPGKAVACIDRRVVLFDIQSQAVLERSDPIGALACGYGELVVAAAHGGTTFVRAGSLGGTSDLVLGAPLIFSDGFDPSSP